MERLKVILISSIFSLLVFTIAVGPYAANPVYAQNPQTWQDSSSGLSVNRNDEKKTAGLGFIIKAQEWPSLLGRGGVMGTGWKNLYFNGPINIELGEIKIPGEASVNLSNEVTDWAHNELTFTTGSYQLKVWVSRLTPALLTQSSASSLRLFAGDVYGHTLVDASVNSRPLGPAYPKYVAYSSGGSVRVTTLSSTELELPAMDQNWLLLWYGDNSHFVHSKIPLTYPNGASTYAYQADIPILLILENAPVRIKQSIEGGVDITYSNPAGYSSILPIFGQDYLRVSETEGWSQALPTEVINKVNWWADHMCAYPTTVSETYAYNEISDTASITETFNFLNICSGGTTFAPIPPTLGMVKDNLNVTFSGPVVNGDLYSEFGPTYGIENTNAYSWSISGLKRFTDANRIVIDTGQAPEELEQELVSEAEEIINSGHFAPWIFTDSIPNHNYRGYIYWLNPADVIYHLIEIAAALPNGNAKSNFIDYISSEFSAYPPESVYNLSLDKGMVRKDFSVSGESVINKWKNHRTDVFLEDVPLYSFYAIDRYYELTSQTLPSQTWQEAQDALDRDMREQDWANFYWFKGFEDRRVAVVNANRHFTGMVGFVRLAQLAQDKDVEKLGRALLAKAAVLRLGMSEYPRYLYAAKLVELPPEPDWQARQTAGAWDGFLVNYDWSNAYDDARQVTMLDQFGYYLYDHSGFMEPGTGYRDWNLGKTSAYLTAFMDMVPELARFLTDFAGEDVEIYITKVEALFPHWYAAFAEGDLGMEHNLSHPVDSFQIYMARALIQKETPEKLVAFVDIPWLQEGDLFYVHKLAETIKAYRGTIWDDTVSLSAIPANKSIQLSWEVYSSLPPEITWQIDYEGPPGDQSSPVTGILSDTRTYTLTSLTNYTLYTVTLTAISGSTPLLNSDPVIVMHGNWDDDVTPSATPDYRAIQLTWTISTNLPAEITWQIDYDGPTGDQLSPVTGIPADSRTFTLTGLQYTGYTVTLTVMYGDIPLWTSNPLIVTPVDHPIYLPFVQNAH